MRSRLRAGAASIERTLPLVMTGVLAAGLIAMVATTYFSLARRAEEIVRDRLYHAVREVAKSAEQALDARAATLRSAARTPAIWTAFRSSGKLTDSAAATLARLSSRTDSLPIELWSVEGNVVAVIGTAAAHSRPAPPPEPRRDSVVFGPVTRDGARLRFWAFAPVFDETSHLGWIAQPRYVGGPADAQKSLRSMLGEDVVLHLRDSSSGAWGTAPGAATDSPARRDLAARGLRYFRAGTGETVAEETRVRGTSWFMTLEVPRSAVLARPRTTIRMIAAFAIATLLLGGLASWILSRRITGPLVDLTHAAEAMASEGKAGKVAIARSDEIGKLAAAFNTMVERIVTTQRELEQRVDDSDAWGREVDRANEELRTALAELERANKAKGDFLAMMSHELRTPLNAIGGYADLIEMEVHGPVTDAQRTALGRLSRNKDHLLSLIDHVLTFGRINAGQVPYVFRDESVNRILDDLEPLIDTDLGQNRLNFLRQPSEPDVKVRCDRDKVCQILLNLVSNALKYTPEGGTVSVECASSQDSVEIRVSDTGIGIAPDRLDVIFEPFVQGERSLSRPSEGVGLGLAISRELANGMGGRLTVASVPGEGSVFSLVLRRSHEHGASSVASTEEAAALNASD